LHRWGDMIDPTTKDFIKGWFGAFAIFVALVLLLLIKKGCGL